jgi:CheY-like chemotaxis protein
LCSCAKQYRQWEVLNRLGVRQKIIGISAHADGKDQQKGMDAGMDGFHPKPISMKTLSTLTGSEVTQQSVHGGSAPLGIKRKDVESTAARSTPVVLIASDVPTARPHAVLKIFDQQGWNAEIVNDAGSCLRELQKRNWNFVLIDDDLPDMSGVECIQEFRAWERANRVQSQKHVYLVSEGCHSATREARMYTQPPHGFNGVLSKPVPWGDLRSLIEKSEGDGEMEIIVR